MSMESIEIIGNVLYLKDKTTGRLMPVGLFGSGADESLAEIKDFADAMKESTNRELSEAARKIIESLPSDYTDISNKVNSLVNTVGNNPATEETMLRILAAIESDESGWRAIERIFAELPQEDGLLRMIAALENENKSLNELVDKITPEG